MNKLTILFLTMLLTCLPMAMRADSHKEKRDDTRYLAGAVPVVDGKVVFSKEFQIPGMSQKQIYDTVMKWMKSNKVNDMFAKNGYVREDGRMVHDMFLMEVKKPSESKGPWDYYKQIAVLPGEEVFTKLSESTCKLVKK